MYLNRYCDLQSAPGQRISQLQIKNHENTLTFHFFQVCFHLKYIYKFANWYISV